MKYHTIAVLMLSVGIGALRCSSPGEEGKVRKQFDLLSEEVSKAADERPLTTARKVRNIGTLFAQTCTLKAHIDSFSGTYTPDEISAHAASSRSQFSKLSLRFYDVNIDFPDEGTATVIVTARLTGISPVGDSMDETHELHCILKHIGDEWLFTQIEVVEVLRK